MSVWTVPKKNIIENNSITNAVIIRKKHKGHNVSLWNWNSGFAKNVNKGKPNYFLFLSDPVEIILKLKMFC